MIAEITLVHPQSFRLLLSAEGNREIFSDVNKQIIAI